MRWPCRTTFWVIKRRSKRFTHQKSWSMRTCVTPSAMLTKKEKSCVWSKCQRRKFSKAHFQHQSSQLICARMRVSMISYASKRALNRVSSTSSNTRTFLWSELKANSPISSFGSDMWPTQNHCNTPKIYWPSWVQHHFCPTTKLKLPANPSLGKSSAPPSSWGQKNHLKSKFWRHFRSSKTCALPIIFWNSLQTSSN